LNKVVVTQVRVCIIDSFDLLSLSRAKGLFGIQTPDSFEQTLTAQDLMESGNATGEVVRSVEKNCVGVRDFCTPTK